MDLSLKATRFVIDALEYYLKHFDQLVERKELSEDDISDSVNDRCYLEAIKKDIEKYREDLSNRRETVQVEM